MSFIHDAIFWDRVASILLCDFIISCGDVIVQILKVVNAGMDQWSASGVSQSCKKRIGKRIVPIFHYCLGRYCGINHLRPHL